MKNVKVILEWEVMVDRLLIRDGIAEGLEAYCIAVCPLDVRRGDDFVDG